MLCRGECGSELCLKRPWRPNKLLKLLLPAVEVELRPLAVFMCGGVGMSSADLPPNDPMVFDLSLKPGRTGDDLADRMEFVDSFRVRFVAEADTRVGD